jgi:hypothetical protein
MQANTEPSIALHFLKDRDWAVFCFEGMVTFHMVNNVK